MSVFNAQETLTKMPLPGCKYRSLHKFMLELADINNENLLMNQSNI